MSRKRYMPEQIIGKLRKAEVVFCLKSSRREGLEGFRYTDHIWKFPRSDESADLGKLCAQWSCRLLLD